MNLSKNHHSSLILFLCACLSGVRPGLSAESGTNQASAAAGLAAPPAQPAATNQASAAPAPAAAPAEFKPGDRNIRFAFEGLPYGDVVARFAQMVNKPLIAETNLDGTLSFSDSRPYTYDEALETLNLILSLKGAMLIESGRYLRLVPVKELAQMPLRIFRGLDKAEDVKPSEVVTVVLSLQNLDASEIAPAITSMLSNAGAVAPLSRGRGLIVTDRMANIKRIRNLLDEVDTAPASQRQMHSYTLKNASGVVLVDLINRTFGAASAPRRSEFNPQTRQYHQLAPDPSDYVTAVFDDASRTLVLFGPADRVAMAENLIKQFEEKSGVAAGELKVFYPQSVSAMELARMIRQAMPSVADERDNPASAAMKARLIIDMPANRLIATAPAASQLEEMEKLVKQIDSGPVNGARQLKPITLKYTSANSIVTMLMQLYSRQFRAEEPRRRVVATAANDDKTLLVEATPEMLQLIEAAIKTLDVEPARGPFEVRTFQLTQVDANDLAQTLARLFDERMSGRRNDGTPQPRFESDPTSNTLIVAATPEQFTRIDQLIKELRASVEVATEIRTFPLKYCDPDQMVQLLQTMLQDDGGNPYRRYRYGWRAAATSDKLRIATAPAQNAVVVQGPPDKLRLAQDLIRTLDQEKTEQTATIRTVHLKQAQAEDIAQAVTRTLENRSSRVQTRRTTITPVSASNSLLINGPSAEVEEVLQIIQDLDKESVGDKLEFHIYRLENGKAQEVSRILDQMLRGLTQSRSRFARASEQVPVTVAVDDRSNSLIISATPDSFKLIDKLLNSLDQAPKHAERTMNLYTLVNADPFEMASKIQAMYADRPREEQVSAEGDYFSSTLTVVAPQKDFAEIDDLIRRLDAAALDHSIQVRMIALDKIPAAQMAAMLTNLYAQMATGELRLVDKLPPQSKPREVIKTTPLSPGLTNSAAGTNEAPPGASTLASTNPPGSALFFPTVAIAVDKAANALLLSGPAYELDHIQSMIRDLTRASASKDTELRVYPLEKADPVVVARMLNELFRPDGSRFDQYMREGRGNRGANRGYSGRDGQPLFMIPPARVTVVADERSRSLIVRAQPTDFALLEPLIKQLDVEGTSLGAQARLVPLKHATAQSLSMALTTLFTQRSQTEGSPEMQRRRPIIVPDPRSNSLLIAASEEDNRALDGLLEKLDRQPENAAVSVTVIGLRHNDSTRVAAMLMGVFAAHRQSTTAPGQPAVPQDLVHVEADPLSNGLVISASPENLELIKGLLTQIDVEPVAQEGLIQTFTLQRADAQRAATMLRSLLDQGIYRPGMMASGNRRSRRDAIAVTVDQRSNTLIVSASPENLVVVKELIKQIDTQNYGAEADIRLFHLKNARASQLATVLEQFFRSKRAGETAAGATERSIPVSVTPDDRTGTLLVTGGREAFEAVERMVAQLDSEAMVARTNFKVVPLKQATAGKLQATLTQLLSQRPPTIRGEPLDPITVVADSWANALIVGASPADMAMVESLISQLDNDQGPSGTEVQVLVLAKADARQVAQTITSLYRSGGPGSSSPVTVNVDERLNAVVVSAGQADLKRIAELVKKLDSDRVSQVAEIRIFPLMNARAVPLAAILTQLLNQKPVQMTTESSSRQTLLQFIARSEDGKELLASALKEGVLVVPDQRANSLVISAPVEYMKLLEHLIARLDAVAPQLATIKVFNLKNADARQMMNVLQGLFHLQPTTQPNANTRTIQYNLVKPVTGEDPFASDDEVAASAVVGSAEESALSVTVDLRSNSLLIGGSEHYVDLASQIVETLDSSPAQERKSEVYRLKNSRATEIQTALQNFLKQDQALITAAVGQQAMAQELLDREAAIVAETNSNTLLISATPRNFGQLKELVEQLDQPQRQVLIQVLLAEVTLNQGDDLGVEWTYGSKGSPTAKVGSDLGLASDLKKFGGFSSAISGDNFSFLFRALETEGRLQVLSRPQILTADNQLATIKVGQQVPVVDSSQTIALNGNSVNTFKYQDVGVTLTVTPRISPDGFVKMDVSPQITQLSSQTVTISPGFDAPIINQRLATTAVSVQSGQSILIGGLISSTDDSTKKSLPFLSKVPLLGLFFRSQSRTRERTELLIVLTPQILVNGVEPGMTKPALGATREQLDRSSIKDTFKTDPIQKQILEPLYPELKTNAPTDRPPASKADPKP